MNVTRRKFLKLISALPVISQAIKHAALDDTPVVSLEDELELELEAWDEVSDGTWREWVDDVRYYDTGTLTVSDNDNALWIVVSDNCTNATSKDVVTSGYLEIV